MFFIITDKTRFEYSNNARAERYTIVQRCKKRKKAEWEAINPFAGVTNLIDKKNNYYRVSLSF
jgi:hypothetical protein